MHRTGLYIKYYCVAPISHVKLAILILDRIMIISNNYNNIFLMADIKKDTNVVYPLL
jgi:hypothetical protein